MSLAGAPEVLLGCYIKDGPGHKDGSLRARQAHCSGAAIRGALGVLRAPGAAPTAAPYIIIFIRLARLARLQTTSSDPSWDTWHRTSPTHRQSHVETFAASPLFVARLGALY